MNANVTRRYKYPNNKRQGRKISLKTLSPIDQRVLSARVKIGHAKLRLESWRRVASWLGDTSKATACNRLAKDLDFRPAVELIDLIECAELPVKKIETEACPDCGSVHTGRCHGRPVVTVVTLAPGERVTRPATKLIRRWRDLPVAELARAIEGRVPYAREDV